MLSHGVGMKEGTMTISVGIGILDSHRRIKDGVKLGVVLGASNSQMIGLALATLGDVSLASRM